MFIYIYISKRTPSIFNDESTGSFICLAYSAFPCFLTSSMPVSGSTVLYTITPQSGIDHDFVSVVKILLKASPHSFLRHTCGYVTCSKVNAKTSRTSSDVPYPPCPQSTLHTPHPIALPPLLPATSETPHI
jgi:hypothetical protein